MNQLMESLWWFAEKQPLVTILALCAILIGMLALAIVIFSPALNHPCQDCEDGTEDRLGCRPTCPEYQAHEKQSGGWL